MEHLAILAKKRKLLSKIISGEKTIESRWYKSKIVPWDQIKVGEAIYFKESGDPVTVQAVVAKVMQFHLPEINVAKLLHKYGAEIGFTPEQIPEKIEWCKGRKYCVLIRLKDVKEIEPFKINKKGFGLMAAWITTPTINSLKVDYTLFNY
ncbi:MAG TPA: hypothetical protein VJI32_04540 [Candidatus Nanoarchaeia archaeon]|nr:hypothetical protein [Candidatus Nanoarchaeia archaeon]